MNPQNIVVHDFNTELTYSHACDENPCWEEIYRKAFPTMVGMHNHRKDGNPQRSGIDRSIILESAKQVLIDEKSRRIKDTGDIMLEYVSNDKRKTPGWVVKPLLSDYIAYAFIPSGIAYLLPVIQLQGAWAKYKDEWLAHYGTLSAPNRDYNTLNCPVKTAVLFSKMGAMLRVSFTTFQQTEIKL